MYVAVALLTGCSTKREQVIVEKPVEVKVPVAVPCVVNKPWEPTSLRDRVPRATWDAMTTDQRERLAQAQAMERKAFGDRLTIATAGCA